MVAVAAHDGTQRVWVARLVLVELLRMAVSATCARLRCEPANWLIARTVAKGSAIELAGYS